MKKSLFIFALLLIMPEVASASTQLYFIPGTYTFTVPFGVSSINVFLIGGGGGGGGGNAGWGSGAGGGCSGAVNGASLTVSPGQTFTIAVGAGGSGGGTASNGGTGGFSRFGSISATGGSWGRSGYYNFNGSTGGSGGGSGGGGGGNGWPGFQQLSSPGGSGGTNNPYTLSSTQTGYSYDEDGTYPYTYTSPAPSPGACVGGGWSVNPGTYITKVSWSAGQGGQVPVTYNYWGGGGGGGVVINNSTVNGSAGSGTNAGYPGPAGPGPGGQGYGAGGGGTGLDYYATGGSGAPGVVYVEWTDIPAACAISLSPNPASYSYNGTATLTYSSSNSTGFYINNVGWMTPNSSGSFSVPRAATTDYSCQAGNGTATTTSAATLTVTPPPSPTATIAASSTSIYTGESTGIHATFAAGSGDTLTHDNIDSPEGTGLGATTNPDAGKTITFTPTQPGNYTFYDRAQTSYFTAWTTYAQIVVHVSNPPHCTPAYTCSGQTIQYTNGGCHISDVTTCTPPAFCSAGSSTCLYPPPGFNSGASGLTGHLQAVPTLLPRNAATKLYWNVSNVSSCAVTGSNGDHWSGASSGGAGAASSPIVQQTVFTLSCAGLDHSTINESATVNILPVFQER